jgi:hypothetical protein
MERNIYHKVQEFFASINGGFCEQTDDSDVNDGSYYQVLEYLTSEPVFRLKKALEALQASCPFQFATTMKQKSLRISSSQRRFSAKTLKATESLSTVTIE